VIFCYARDIPLRHCCPNVVVAVAFDPGRELYAALLRVLAR
jgi:hypothetical protein